MTNRARSTTPALLTPRQVGDRLLEAATLTAYRSRGADGLLPVKDCAQHRFRPADVEAYLQRHGAAA